MRNRSVSFRNRRSTVFFVTALLVALLSLPALFSPGKASAQRAHQTIAGFDEQGHLNCGFDAYGADEALSRHQLNRLFASVGKSSRAVASSPTAVQTVGDI